MAKVVVLYDSTCSLCTNSMKRMKKLDWLAKANWTPLEEWNSIQFSAEDLREEIHVVLENGEVLKGFYGVRKVLLLFPVTFPVALLLYMPFVPIWGVPIYRLIAKNRHLFFHDKCTDDTCSIRDS
ncbi:thiol-disulfide oxidoreductase DCC family protein [Bacillus massilinigeriensis]|uniref:thiol-disulfide oxidoreductase DCC family protein n=1 Tax=Bacillus mediterraneensis TaxID=1805474 RepID=UPI001F419CF8|nr:DUF393 domain-containing protein [Bacillus mediterraneensis]